MTDVVQLPEIKIKCGQIYIYDALTISDDAGVAEDLAVWTGKFSIGETHDGPSIVSVAPVLGSDGSVTATLSAAHTAALQPYWSRPLVYQIDLDKDDMTLAHRFQGQVIARPEIGVDEGTPVQFTLPNGGRTISYSTRAAFISDTGTSGYEDGTIVWAGNGQYKKTASATTLADKPGWVPLAPYALSQWGVVGDGTTQSAKVQAAVTFCAGNLLIHDVQAACLGTVVTIAKPMRFEAPTYGDDTSSSSQPTNPAFGFVALTAGMTMIRVISATASNRLYGVHLKGFAMEGENLAAKGVHFSSVTDSGVEDIWAERFRDKAVQFDDGNGGELSNGNYVRGYRYQCGTNAAARKGMALHLDRDATVGTQGHTKFTIERVQAETPQVLFTSVTNNAGTARYVATGHQFEIGDVIYIYDSAVYKARDVTVTGVVAGVSFDTAQAYVSTDTGRCTASPGCYFAEIDNSLIDFITSTVVFFDGLRGSGARAARKITVDHLAGHVLVGSQAIVKVVNINTEPSSMTLFDDDCAIQYAAHDRVNGGHYETERFTFSQMLALPAQMGLQSALGTGTVGANAVPVVTFPKAGTPRITFFIPPQRTWDNGTIASLVLYYSNTGGASRWLVKVDAESPLVGGGFAAWDLDTAVTVPVGTAAGINTYTLATSVAYTRGDAVVVDLIRDHGSGSDTEVGAVVFWGAAITYTSPGPNGAGANRFEIPAMRF